MATASNSANTNKLTESTSPILTDPHDILGNSVESQRYHNQSMSIKPISITNDIKPDNSGNDLSDSVTSSKPVDDGDSTPDDAEIATNYLEDTPSQHRQPSNALTNSPDEDQKQYTPNPKDRSNSALRPLNFSDTEEPEPTQTTKRRRRNAVTITVDTSANNTPNRPSRSSTMTSNSSYGSSNDTASIPIGCNSISSAGTESVCSSAIPPSLNSLDSQSRRNSVLSGIPEQDEQDHDNDDDDMKPMTKAILEEHNKDTKEWKPEETDDWKPIWALLLCYYEGKESDTESVDQQSISEEICRFINDGEDPTQYNPVTTRNRASTTNTASSHSTDTPASWNSISTDGRSSRGQSIQSVSTDASLNSYGSNDSISRIINNAGSLSRRGSIQSVSTDASLNSYASNDSIAAAIQNMNKAPPLLQPINEEQESKANQMNHDVISTITGPSRPGTAKSNTSFDFASRARSSSDGSEDSIGAVVIDSDEKKEDNPDTNDQDSDSDDADNMEYID